MNLNDYKAGRYVQQYEYKSFSPQPISHAWEISDSEVQTLLSDADRVLGELPPILERMQIEQKAWLSLTQSIEALFTSLVGKEHSVQIACEQQGKR